MTAAAPPPALTIRPAVPADAALLVQLIGELAVYEKMSADVQVTPALLEETMFRKGGAEALIAEWEGEPVGFALYFHNFSTFVGRPGLYLEDLFVRPEARGRGIGTILLSTLARIAVERNCGRMEWSCLDWNQTGIDFYLSKQAEPMGDWTTYRLDGDRLNALAAEAPA